MASLSDRGANLIASFEGFRSCPYRDAVGVWTIGYGSTRGVGPATPCITKAQALARMKSEVTSTYGAAVNALGLPLSQNQFDALTSFVYNVGPGGIAASTTVGKRLRARDWRGAADALLAWNKAGGKVLAGLVRRRRAERALFLEGGPALAPSAPKPSAPTGSAPPFPLPNGYYYGPRGGPARSVSGYYGPYGGPSGAPGLKQWQGRMNARGWALGAPDGLYGPKTEKACRSFQAEKRLAVDGKIGPVTWSAAWTAPLT